MITYYPTHDCLGDALNKSVESVTWLGNDESLQPRSRESLNIQTKATLERNAGNINDFANSIRAMRRHEIERIGLCMDERRDRR